MSSLESRTRKLEDKLDFLYCYVKNHQGGGGTETDPIFTASPSFSITQSDINNWNSGGGIPTLEQVTSQNNTTSNSIISQNFIQANTLRINSGNYIGNIDSGLLQSQQNYQLPNQSGTFALLSDIPTGNYVPMAGMNIASGERMQESFLLANYNIMTEVPPANSIAFGVSRQFGGFLYQGTDSSGGQQYQGSFNGSPSSLGMTATLNSPNGNYNSNLSLYASNIITSVYGGSVDGMFTGNSQFNSGVDAINRNSYARLSSQGQDSENETYYDYQFTVSNNGYNFTNLRNAQGDITFTKTLVARQDGTIGTEDKISTIPTASTIVVNTAQYPEISTVYVNKLVKKASVVQFNLTLNMTNYAGGGQWTLGTLPVGYRPSDNILIQANMRYASNGTNSVEIVNLLLNASSGEISIFKNFPNSSYLEIFIGTQFTII